MAFHRVYYEVNGMKADNVWPKIHGIDFTQFAESTIFVESVNPAGVKKESEIGKEVQGTLIEDCAIS